MGYRGNFKLILNDPKLLNDAYQGWVGKVW